MTIEITFADISYHLEQGDLQEWSEKLRALEKARQLAGADMIEYVPVRHGRWVPLYDDVWECSECEQAEQFAKNIESTSRYCPNCGARMDQDDKDTNVLNKSQTEREDE